MKDPESWDAIIVGGGIAGTSAAIYLGRARRTALVIDAGKSMAKWEPDIRNYLGFPDGISGTELLRRGHRQARQNGVTFLKDRVKSAARSQIGFTVKSEERELHTRYLLIATGIFHIPPSINGVKACLGHSMFFCKDCDGMRVQDKRVAIYGSNQEAAEYALGMLVYSQTVAIVTDGRVPVWDKIHSGWIAEYKIPVYPLAIRKAARAGCQIQCLHFIDGSELLVDALFTTRGDIYHNELAKTLGAKLKNGEIVVDHEQCTSVPGLYAAGCVTPANCQMIIAAGQGATAAQSMNRKLFEAALAGHALPRTPRRRMRL